MEIEDIKRLVVKLGALLGCRLAGHVGMQTRDYDESVELTVIRDEWGKRDTPAECPDCGGPMPCIMATAAAHIASIANAMPGPGQAG